MFSPETLVPQAENQSERSREQEMFLENMLQMAWFEERYTLLGNDEKAVLLGKIRAAASSEGERERIDTASEDEMKQIILEEMILSPSGEGGREREWYREVFLKSPESRQLLGRFESEPESAAKEVEALYRQSLH